MTASDESRMVKDPICGKDVDTLRARAVGIFGGVTYYFCSADCKSKFNDPRQSGGSAPPMLERRRSEPTHPPAGAADDSSGSSVRYAHSRIRRITGEVGTPMVQIDLSPNSAKRKPAESEPSTSAVEEGDAEAAPRSSRTWIVVVVVMLIIASAVVFFTLKRQ
ncbi:MAG: hypothetical protein JWN44_3453 [Myxococcales bacterium]|nr:hypothetical protein [Myxococcales bacterium]